MAGCPDFTAFGAHVDGASGGDDLADVVRVNEDGGSGSAASELGVAFFCCPSDARIAIVTSSSYSCLDLVWHQL